MLQDLTPTQAMPDSRAGQHTLRQHEKHGPLREFSVGVHHRRKTDTKNVGPMVSSSLGYMLESRDVRMKDGREGGREVELEGGIKGRGDAGGAGMPEAAEGEETGDGGLEKGRRGRGSRQHRSRQHRSIGRRTPWEGIAAVPRVSWQAARAGSTTPGTGAPQTFRGTIAAAGTGGDRGGTGGDLGRAGGDRGRRQRMNGGLTRLFFCWYQKTHHRI